MFQWDATHENLQLKSTVTFCTAEKSLHLFSNLSIYFFYKGKITKSFKADGSQFGGVGLAFPQGSKVL